MTHFFERKVERDSMSYCISAGVIRDTEKVLDDYAKMAPSNEGLVYWGGNIVGNEISITAIIAPDTESDFGRVTTSHRSNFEFVKTLNNNKIIQIAQVHSHPSSWVSHSPGDNKWAAFKSEGLISIVVPNYGIDGMLPLVNCGVHRFTKGSFHRLSTAYVKTHFIIENQSYSNFIDLRKK
ncbi:hypothetical protein [Candidatus Nitrosotenuis aquarius]|uniref:hypothetical protein n=1 Tax=Candidatus Nitrosotenuis aquarius TaxID=1846278 RepID=UPI000C1E7B66|nr:hypothetical protein [Candidatus Nitrosotenuis aquarius]